MPAEVVENRLPALALEIGRVLRLRVERLLHEDGADPDTVADYVARWGLLPRPRAEKSVQFLTDPTWRSYMTFYVEGLPLCRQWVKGDPGRFQRLLTEQLTPADLVDVTAVS